jgi:MFS family permease
MNTSTQSISLFRSLLAALLAVVIAVTAFLAPATADTAGQRSTRNIILGAIVAAAGVILYNNYHHKQVAANTVVGRTRDGGVVYGDGRIVYPDGTVLYTGNRNRQRCGYDGYGVPCGRYAYAYHPYGGHRHGHHGDRDENRGDGGNSGDGGNGS